jgi:23S rRNA (pseudouridine1915-N3)-methyltransferase
MIRIICIGKIKEQYLVNEIEDYLKRINKYHRTEIVELPDSSIDEESEKILKQINKKGFNILLAIKGDKVDSIEFSDIINNKLMMDANINFIIGGSNGVNQKVKDMVDQKISFSDLTFPHGLFRGMLLEQIYRSFKIINHETYHK